MYTQNIQYTYNNVVLKRTEHFEWKIAIDFFVNFKPVLSLYLSLSHSFHFEFVFANGLCMFASRASRTIHSIFKYANNFCAASVCIFLVKCDNITCINGG